MLRHRGARRVSVLAAVAVFAVLAALLSTMLVLAERRLAVAEDARLHDLIEALPGVNCGGCGEPSCRAFAEALIAGTAVPAACSVSSAATQRRIAAFLGVDVGVVERRVARLACAGDDRTAPRLGNYHGERTCSAAAAVAAGGKACAWGCLGFGDCERVCDFDAIRMDAHSLPVVDEALCTACGDCVRACPKDLFHLVPAAEPLWVACSNPQAGSELVEVCAVACTACGKCVRDAPDRLVMDGNLPRLIASESDSTPRRAIDRCPTGAILWIHDGRRELGHAAREPRAWPEAGRSGRAT